VVLTAGLSGWLASNSEPQQVIYLTLFLPFLSILGTFFIKKNNDKLNNNKFSRENFDWKIIGGGATLIALSILSFQFEIAFKQEIIFAITFGLLLYMMWLVTKKLPRQNFYILLSVMMALFLFRATPSVGAGASWWLIDELKFDEIFLGILQQISAVVGLVVLWFISGWVVKSSTKKVLLFLAVVGALLNFPELAVYYGWHENIGWTAREVFLLDTAAGSPLSYISMIPVLSLIAFYAPAENRGTWFAIGSSFMNLALSGGAILTKYLNEFFIITREVKDEMGNILTAADYSQLGNLMITVVVIGFLMGIFGILFFLRKYKV
jgi:hypothetical protein